MLPYAYSDGGRVIQQPKLAPAGLRAVNSLKLKSIMQGVWYGGKNQPAVVGNGHCASIPGGIS